MDSPYHVTTTEYEHFWQERRVAHIRPPRHTPSMTPTPTLDALAADARAALAAAGDEACAVLDALTWLGRAGGR